MHALILTDASFATRERALLSRLEVGLADEGVRIIHAIPRSAAADESGQPAGELFVQRVLYEDRGPGLLRRMRDRRLAESLDALREPQDERPIDIVHVFGEGAWATGADMAGRFQIPLAVEVWSSAALERVPHLRIPGPDRPPLVYFAPDRPVERRLRDVLEGAPVASLRYTPWGVHTPAEPHDLLAQGRAPSAMIVGSGLQPSHYAALLSALAGGPQAELMVFADAGAIARAGAWSMVSRLGLTDRFTLTPDAEVRRDLTLRCDALLVPDVLGEHRSIALDAMAAGIAVIAAADPMVGWLIDGVTARLVEPTSAEAWGAALSSVLADRQAAARLASSAREHVRLQQRASAHVASVVDAYEWLTTDTLPFGATPC